MFPKALVVEDDADTRVLLRKLLRAQGCDVDLAVDGEEAIERLEREEYSVILLDIVLPKVSGTAVMDHLRQTNPTPMKVSVSDSGSTPSSDR